MRGGCRSRFKSDNIVWVTEIHSVTGEPHLAEVRALFQEYWQSFGFTPCFQGFSDELARLPGQYAPPGGRLALALEIGRAHV